MTQIKIHYIRINDFFAFQKQETLKQNFKRNSGKPKTKKKKRKNENENSDTSGPLMELNIPIYITHKVQKAPI